MNGNQAPRISVIIAAYRANETLGACLETILQSDHDAFEVVVVNDGCPEDPGPIAARYGCRVIHQTNGGPGAARNRGAQEVSGDILFFLDADVVARPDTLSRIEQEFAKHPDIGALFGSYGTETPAGNFVSDYKNLLHHYTHQTGIEDAITFCGGFGAIRRELFDSVCGFDPRHRFLEDIDLGYRLHRAGIRIRLKKDLQFTHLKRYTLASLIRSDVKGRAIPWTRLMLANGIYRNDLNTRVGNVFSVPFSLALAVLLLVMPALAVAGQARAALIPAVLLVAGLAWLNRGFLGFLWAERGPWFAMRGGVMLWMGYIYSAFGAAAGAWMHFVSPLEASEEPEAEESPAKRIA